MHSAYKEFIMEIFVIGGTILLGAGLYSIIKQKNEHEPEANDIDSLDLRTNHERLIEYFNENEKEQLEIKLDKHRAGLLEKADAWNTVTPKWKADKFKELKKIVFIKDNLLHIGKSVCRLKDLMTLENDYDPYYDNEDNAVAFVEDWKISPSIAAYDRNYMLYASSSRDSTHKFMYEDVKYIARYNPSRLITPRIITYDLIMALNTETNLSTSSSSSSYYNTSRNNSSAVVSINNKQYDLAVDYRIKDAAKKYLYGLMKKAVKEK